MTHKSDDYKISAVKYYLKNKDNIRKTCKIFDCNKSTLQRWIQRYKTSKNITRRNRKPISYKITKPQVKYALDLLKQNEQLTMNEIFNILKNYLHMLSIFIMPMRLKSELYKKEQEQVIDKIISILDLQNKTTYTLYELDTNKDIQLKIMELIPEIRKWFSFNGIKAVGEPSRIKRSWLSIIKHLLKTKYSIESKDFQFTENGRRIRTHVYSFTPN